MTWKTRLRAIALACSSAKALLLASAAATALSLTATPTQAQTTPATRTAFVHLFEWKWTDIAKECEDFLGPKGFAAVQVSPPNEHTLVTTGDGAPYPWWMRYQPVSYSLDKSRSGTRAEFVDMVNRCNAKGVAIYVDAIINHMSGGTSGTSIAGNTWTNKNYPRVPYGPSDFHSTCGVNNYNDANNVQNCELSGLQDLNTGSTYVRGKIADYLVDLVNIGVKGFRIDAAKHMSPTDVSAIIDAVNGRVTNKPFWFLEVIGAPGEAVTTSQYQFINNNTVNITEFKYGKDLYNKFAGGGKLSDLQTFAGSGWNMLPSFQAVAFTDNHDNQRGHGGSGNLTYHYGATYDLANVFMLAWPYGYPALMSSYAFNKDTDYDKSFGPPYNTSNGSTKGPWDGGVTQPACFSQTRGGWVCEHRYRPITNMVGFRNAVNGNWNVTNWWSNGNNQIAFGRGSLGFVAINKEGASLVRTFATGLAAGKYCDVISGDLVNGACTGDSYTVDSVGNVQLTVEPYKAVALHVNAKPATSAPASVNANFKVQNAAPAAGQSVYVVGNVAALGAWDACKAVKLSADNGAFSGLVSLPASTNVQYKFIKYSTCTSPTWEGGSNRSFTTPATGASSQCGVFGTTTACSTTGGGSGTTGSSTLTFNVTASTVLGQSVYVVGSISALGSWSPASAKAMTVVPGTGSGQSNTWRVSVSVPAGAAFEYKYIKQAGADVSWETGANRTNTSAASGQTKTVTDTWR
jgi:alpha-amylase